MLTEACHLISSRLNNNIPEHALHKLLRIAKEYLPDLVRRCVELEAKRAEVSGDKRGLIVISDDEEM